MPVQHEVWWRRGGDKHNDFLDTHAHLAGQQGHLHIQCRTTVAVHDLPKDNLASEHFRKKESIKRERQLVIFGKLIGEFETIGDELGGRTSAVGRYPFDGLQLRFHVVHAQSHVNCDTPARVTEILEAGRSNRTVVPGKASEQARELFRAIGLILRVHRICVAIPG